MLSARPVRVKHTLWGAVSANGGPPTSSQHRPQRPAGSTHSSTRGLRPPEQLERPADGRGLGPQDALKRDSRGLSRVVAGKSRQCVKVTSLSRVQLLATPWTAAHQAPPSMGFSRQEYWSFFLKFILFYFLTLQYCIGFAIHQHESTTGAFAMVAGELATAPTPRPRQPLRACPHSQPNPDGVIETARCPGSRGSLLQEDQIRRQDSTLCPSGSPCLGVWPRSASGSARDVLWRHQRLR